VHCTSIPLFRVFSGSGSGFKVARDGGICWTWVQSLKGGRLGGLVQLDITADGSPSTTGLSGNEKVVVLVLL